MTKKEDIPTNWKIVYINCNYSHYSIQSILNEALLINETTRKLSTFYTTLGVVFLTHEV